MNRAIVKCTNNDLHFSVSNFFRSLSQVVHIVASCTYRKTIQSRQILWFAIRIFDLNICYVISFNLQASKGAKKIIFHRSYIFFFQKKVADYENYFSNIIFVAFQKRKIHFIAKVCTFPEKRKNVSVFGQKFRFLYTFV